MEAVRVPMAATLLVADASIASLMDVVVAAMLPLPERSWVTSSWMEMVSASTLAALDAVSTVTLGSITGGPVAA